MLDFLYNNLPSSILFAIGPINIYWYGLILMLAVFISFLLLIKISPFKKNIVFDLTFYLVIFGLIGARLWHVLFYNFGYFLENPLEVVKVWHGGMAVHGSILAGLLTIYFFARKKNINFWRLTDSLVVVMPLGQAIGRWGNYFNQELFGKQCEFNWCIPIQNNTDHFHPVFLYESLLNLFLFVGLLLAYKTKKLLSGMITFIYLIGYSTIRFFMEFLRLDVNQMIGGLKWVQWLSLLVIIASIIGIYKVLSKEKN